MVVGLVYAVVYYFVFYFMITKLNLKTPGREPDDVEPKLYRRSDVNAAKAEKKAGGSAAVDMVSAMVLKGLGGKANLSDLDCCATRLRVTVQNAELVDDAMLKASGASGVIHKGNGVQVIYGPKVSVIKSNLKTSWIRRKQSIWTVCLQNPKQKLLWKKPSRNRNRILLPQKRRLVLENA